MKKNNIEENNKYRQGRSKEQYEASFLGASVSIGTIILIVIYRLIISLVWIEEDHQNK